MVLPLKKNRLKDLIVNRELALGTHIDAFSPTLVEVAGLAGLAAGARRSLENAVRTKP